MREASGWGICSSSLLSQGVRSPPGGHSSAVIQPLPIPLPLLSAELVTALAVASLRVLHHPFWFLSALPLPQINSSLKFPLLPQLDLGLIKLSYGFSSDLLP